MKQSTQPAQGASKAAIQKLQDQLQARAAAMSDVDSRHRTDGKWSVAEILEHLYLTYTGTIKGLNRVLEAGKPLARRPTVKDRLAAFVVTGLGYLPEGRKAPVMTAPKGIDVTTLRAQIGAQIATMNELLSVCARRYGSRTRILDHPVLGPLTADGWRKFHVAHGRHHLKQIERRSSARG